MHELSIAMSIVEMAEEEVESRGCGPVRAVHMKLGALSGVVREALLSSWELAREGTDLQGTRLEIEVVPIVAYCARCDGPRPVESPQWMACSECRTPVWQVLHGRELQVTALEMQA